MALKAVLDSLDGVDEALGAYYAKNEGDGRFYLNVEGVEAMPAVSGLKSKNRELLDEVKSLKQLRDEYGMTPEEVAKLKERAESIGNGGDKALQKRIEELEAENAQIRENAKKEIATATETAEADQAAARKYFLDGEITRAITAAKGVPELLSHVVESQLEVERGNDGAFKLRVLGRDGQPRIKDSQGNPFGLDDLVTELRQDARYGRAFEPDGRGGSGAQGSSGGAAGAAVNPFKAETRNLTEQTRLARENPEMARRLAAQAGVKISI